MDRVYACRKYMANFCTDSSETIWKALSEPQGLFANKDGVKGYEELSSDKPLILKYYSALADEATNLVPLCINQNIWR